MSEKVCKAMLEKLDLARKNSLKVMDDVYSVQGAEAEQVSPLPKIPQ